MEQPAKLLPEPTAVSTPFWEGTLRGDLMLQKCRACGNVQHPPREGCRECLSADLGWIKASGRGEVYTFTVVHRATAPGFLGAAPYVVAIVRLAEGPRMTTTLECPPDEARIGAAVAAVFDKVSNVAALVRFKPVA